MPWQPTAPIPPPARVRFSLSLPAVTARGLPHSTSQAARRMPDPRSVSRAIDLAFEALDRHPRLFAHHLHAGHTCERLARRFEAYRRTRPEAVGGRLEHDEVERVDEQWEETEARRREETFGVQRREHDAEFLGRWEQKTRLEKLLWIETELTRMSTIKAANVASGRSSPLGMLPAGIGADGTADPEVVQAIDLRGDLYVIDARIDRIRDEIRAAQGLSAAKSTVTMSKEEKDAEILAATGVPASKLSTAKPWLGSPETIRRVRHGAGRDTLGNPLPRAYTPE